MTRPPLRNWREIAAESLATSQQPKPAKPPKATTRRDLIREMRVELDMLAPSVRGRLGAMLDAIESARR